MLESVFILLLALISLQVGVTHLDLGIKLLATLSVALGLRGFLASGGPFITPSGVYMLSSAVFVGVGALLGVQVEEWGVRTESYSGATESLMWATFVLLLLHVFTYYGYWSKPLNQNPIHLSRDTDCGRPDSVLLVLGLGLSAVGALTVTTSILGPLPEASCFAGVVLVGSAVFSRRSCRVGPVALATLVATIALYYYNTFNGFGRLKVAAVFVALLFLMSLRAQSRSLKWAIVTAIPPALIIMTMQRGSSSIIDPIYVFTGLNDLAASAGLAFGRGETFLASAVLLFPRALWPDKPVGFGQILARIFHPQYAANGHSDVALFAGEWFYNFGWVGLVIMVPIIGILIRRLDVWSLRQAALRDRKPGDLVLLAAVATVAAGMMDLFWVGTSTFMARTGARAIVLLFAYWGVRLISASSASKTRRRARSDVVGSSRSGRSRELRPKPIQPESRSR